MLTIIFTTLAFLALAYQLVCIVRIWATWFPTGGAERLGEFLARFADPWLKLFRSRAPARGAIDFSPIIAIGILWILSTLFFGLAAGGSFTFGLLFALAIEVVWQFFAFMLLLYVVLGTVRAIAFMARWNTFGPGWQAVDGILNPALFRLNRLLHGKRVVHYTTGLVTMIAVFLALRISLGFLVEWLGKLLKSLPF